MSPAVCSLILSTMMFWVIAWFCIVICVTTLNKTLFTSLKCPYPCQSLWLLRWASHDE